MPKREAAAAGGAAKAAKGNDQGFHRVAAWFLGPKGENADVLRRLVNEALTKHIEFREDYLPPDPIYITKQIKADKYYQEQIEKLFAKSKEMNDRLFNSVAFNSMRYQGHMLWDITMPGIVGYFSAALYNQNNTAAEASPVTTQYERDVGDELCKMVGFTIPDTPDDSELPEQPDDDINPTPYPWGHITADGSIANIEGMWSARNLKYHALAIQQVLKTNPAFKSAQDLSVPFWDASESDGKKMRTLIDLTAWECLNVDVDDALNLAPRITALYSIPAPVITAALVPYDIQQQGVGGAENLFCMHKKAPVVFCPSDKHYSWPKAAALLGIGMANLKSIPVDNNGRMNLNILKDELERCVKEQIPVIQVVTVVGSTEESAVDDVQALLALRREFQVNKKLSFPIHADGAWGAFYCCMMRKDEKSPPEPTASIYKAGQDDDCGFVPRLPLSEFVESALSNLKNVDTVTCDPHKSGYIQYPAGSLLYRNGAMRDLLTLEAPVVFKGALDPGVGVYGIEGSKPGAAAAAVYLSQQVIGFDKPGYGQILGEGNFNVKVTWCILNTLADENDPFEIVTFNQLGETPEEAKANKAFIRKNILGKTNEEIAENPKAMKFLRSHGPDLSINAWSLNFKEGNLMDPEQKLNDSLDLCNELVHAVNEATYILNDPVGLEPISKNGFFRKKLIFTNSTFENDKYGSAVQRMKDDLGVGEHISGDLQFMVNTVGKPFETATDFMETFKTDLTDIILLSAGRVTDPPDIHGFLGIPSGKYLFFHHFPMYHMRPHQYQVTVRAKFVDEQSAAMFWKHIKEHPDQEPVIANHDPTTLYKWVYDPTIWVDGYAGGMPPPPSTDPPSKTFMTAQLEVVDVPLFHHFLPLKTAVEPKNLTYFLYGYDGFAHMCHWITVFPAWDQVVTLTGVPEGVSDEMLQLGFLVTFTEIEETYYETSPIDAGKTYKITYTGEGGVEKNTTVTIDYINWFSSTRVNAMDH